MVYNVIPTHHFQKEFKNLLKKFPSIKTDLLDIIESLQKQPLQGAEVF